MAQTVPPSTLTAAGITGFTSGSAFDPTIPISSDEYNEEALPDHGSRYHGYRPITYAVQLLVLGARARRVQ